MADEYRERRREANRRSAERNAANRRLRASLQSQKKMASPSKRAELQDQIDNISRGNPK